MSGRGACGPNLIAIAAGEHPLLGWMVATDFEPDTIEQLHHLIDVENRDDERIEGLIADGATLDPSKRLIRFLLDGGRLGSRGLPRHSAAMAPAAPDPVSLRPP